MVNKDWLVKEFILLRMTPDEVRNHLIEAGIDEALVDQAYEEFRKLTGNKRYLSPPAMLVKNQIREGGWYPGADLFPNAKYWPALRNHLLVDKKWPENVVRSIHEASDKILSWLESPYAEKISTRGLVVGYVQSGKTANFTAVISKAADAGYRFFIVLSGTKKSLRRQTQSRLEKELISLNNEFWFSPTTYHDFSPPSGNATFFLSQEKHDKVICVVKKNTVILQRLSEWLKTASPEVLERCPFLIIDDEADEASINTARAQTDKPIDAMGRSTINKHLVKLLTLLPKAAYIGYTATPFANVLIDPRSEMDLYPKDFIVALPKSEGHFGTEDIFGRRRLLEDDTEDEFAGYDMVRIVPDEEANLLRPKRKNDAFSPEITPSLEKALSYFWLCCAARTVRGQGSEYMTMLIHSSQLISAHNQLREVVEEFRNTLRNQLSKSSTKNGLILALKNQWEDEQKAVSPETMGLSSIPFRDLEPLLCKIIENSSVVVDNSQSPFRLSYDDGNRIQIAIGGNTLSRGLTLEGLTVSYFIRSASTYDTLLQMGRWFGYRPGYSDLPRIWMTAELRSHFFDLATIEAEIRRDIDQYQIMGITPKQFGLRIQTRPDLEITSALKMQHAVFAKVRYEKYVQTVLLEHKDTAVLSKNISASEWLLKKMCEGSAPEEANGHKIFRNIPHELITEFIRRYSFHPNNRALTSKLLNEHISEQNEYGSLLTWNVVVRGISEEKRKSRNTITLNGMTFPLVQRARRKAYDRYAHIGVLMTKGDIALDLDLEKHVLTSSDEKELLNFRTSNLPNIGLLIIYPIDKDSQPRESSKDKTSLEASNHLIGLGFVFPPAEGDLAAGGTYVTVDPDLLAEPEFETDEEEDIDE